MNSVFLIGRLTRDPEVKDTNSGMRVAKFTLAVDRPPTKSDEKQTDFPRIVCFGNTAENVGRYIGKGRQVAIQGKIQTGSYTKQDGTKVYTTDVIADRVEFLGSNNDSWNDKKSKVEEYPDFHQYDNDDDIPF